jgi:hypothetical protein
LFLHQTGDDFDHFGIFRGTVVEVPTGKHDVFIEFGRGLASAGHDIGQFKRFEFGPFEETATAEDGSHVAVRQVVDDSGFTSYQADFFAPDGREVLAGAVRLDPVTPPIHTISGDLCGSGTITPPFFGHSLSFSGVALDPADGTPLDGFSSTFTLKGDTHALFELESVNSQNIARHSFSLPPIGLSHGVCSSSSDAFTNPFNGEADGDIVDALLRIRPALARFRLRPTCTSRTLSLMTALPPCALGERDDCMKQVSSVFSEVFDLNGQSCMKKSCFDTCKEERNNCVGTGSVQTQTQCCEINCQVKCGGKVPPADAVPVGCRVVVDATGVRPPPPMTPGGMPKPGGVMVPGGTGQNGGSTGGTKGGCMAGQVETCDKQCVDAAMAKCFAFLVRVSPPSLVSPAPSPSNQLFACYGGYSRTAKTREDAAACMLADMNMRFAGMGKVCAINITSALPMIRNSVGTPYQCENLSQIDTEFCQRVPPTSNSDVANYFGECNLSDGPGGCRGAFSTCRNPTTQATVCCAPNETCTPSGCMVRR